MNERLKKYYQWRIKTILKRKLHIENKILNIITPSYSYSTRNLLLHRAIDSVVKQSEHHLRVNHLIYFDGLAPQNLNVKSPIWYSLKVLSNEKCLRYSTDFRNEGLHAATGGWVMMLSDCNELVPGAFTAIEKLLVVTAGTILFHVRRDNDNQVIPVSLDQTGLCDSSSLAILVNSDIAWMVGYQHRILRDFQYIENIRAMAAHYGFANRTAEDVIGIDRDAIVVSDSVEEAQCQNH